MTLVLAVVVGALIGLSLGALGGGGSILAVPALVHLLGQSPLEATTGSLVVVAVTSVTGAVTAYRGGTVLLARGLAFGLVATGGAVLGAAASTRVPERVLLTAFSALMLVVALALVRRRLRHGSGVAAPDQVGLDAPIVSFRPTFACHCPRALKVLVTATGVGALTGFLGVGGGFLVVPALVLALELGMRHAAGTSLVVITVTSTVALAARAGSDVHPDWPLVLALTAASASAAVVGARLAARCDVSRLQDAFALLVLTVAAGSTVGVAAGL